DPAGFCHAHGARPGGHAYGVPALWPAGAGTSRADPEALRGWRVSFSWPVRVYWEDTDGGGVVYYANYLKFLERARSEWLRSLGYSQRVLAEDPGIVFAVVSLNIEYRKPARLDDELLITCEPKVEGAATIAFA